MAGTEPAYATSASFDTARQMMSFYLSDPNGTASTATFTLTGYDAANAAVATTTATVTGYASTATWVPLTITAPGSNPSGWITSWTLTANNDEDQTFYLDDLAFSVPAPPPPAPPTADFACSPCTVDAGTPVQFTSTTNATTPIYSWDLNGDGSFGDSTAQNPSYTFTNPGTYTVGLQVSDSSDGESTTVDHPVTVYAPPAVTTQPASSLDTTQAQLNGSVNPENAPISSCSFQWGSTTSYGHTMPCDSLPTAGGAPVSVSATIRGLTAGTVYHYRLVAQHSFGGAVMGADASFTTAGNAPSFTASVTAAPAAAGAKATIQATAAAPAGYTVEEYQWSILNNGVFNADTGALGQLLHQFGLPGVHTVAVKATAVNAQGAEMTTTATGKVTVSAAANGCLTQLTKGFIALVASCIKDHSGVYSVSVGTSGVDLDGVELTSATADATLTLDTTGNADPSGKWALTADAPLEASVQNGPDGTIQLFSVDLTKQLLLPVGGATATPNSPGMLLFSLGAGSGCQKGARTVCAQLPGGFPLTGQISLYLAGPLTAPQATIDANVALKPPLSVTGTVSLSGSAATGVNLNSWSIATPSFEFGSVATVQPLKLSYERLDSDQNDPDYGDTDVFQAQGGVTLNLPSETAGLRLGVTFANGAFVRAGVGLNGPLRLGPLLLTQLGGYLELNPTEVGLNVGGQIGVYSFTAGFLYRGAYDGQPWFVQVGSYDGMNQDPNGVDPLSVSWPNPDPRLEVDGALYLYGDGFLSGQVHAEFAFPDLASSNPLISAQASLGGWYAPPANSQQHATYQLSGGLEAQLNFGVLASLSGSVQGFLNDYYSGGQEQSTAAACGQLDGSVFFGLIPIHVTGWAAVNILNGNVEDGTSGGCDNISQYCAPPSATGNHQVPPCLPFGEDSRRLDQTSSGPQQVYVPAHTTDENLLLSGATGVPQVTISGPSGTYQTSLHSGLDAQLPTYLSGTTPAQNQLGISLLHPKPGIYTITPVAGSPALQPVLESHQLPSPDVRTRVTGTGDTRVLHYTLHPQPGQKVQFEERAKDTDTLIGRPTDASHGAITFTPQVSSVYARRSLVAMISENGLAEPAVAVGRYRATLPSPLRAPRSVRVRRARDLVTLTWPFVSRATGYQVTVRGSDGRKTMYVTKRTHRAVRISAVLPGVRLRISVAATGGSRNLAGPARTVTSQPVPAIVRPRGGGRHRRR